MESLKRKNQISTSKHQITCSIISFDYIREIKHGNRQLGRSSDWDLITSYFQSTISNILGGILQLFYVLAPLLMEGIRWNSSLMLLVSSYSPVIK